MKLYPTDRSEDLNSRWKRFIFNIFPSYRRTGARIKFISSDFYEMHLSLKLKLSTRNYVGSVFGGSIFGALDPLYMVQLIYLLRNDYIVWDKSGTIRFFRPIKGKVKARFLITDELLDEIKTKIASDSEMEIDLPAHFEDENGVKYAELVKTLYIADKQHYKEKRKRKAAK
ncbi:MAG: DUF4442 domain-containing protein [bacterium]|nr:DUF4442 domain-containing protein [bacterium]